MNVVIFGLSITSSLANEHAPTYRTLMNELEQRGHNVFFLERNLPWHVERRDIPRSRFGRVETYDSLMELERVHADAVRRADCVIIGSGIPETSAVTKWVTSGTHGVVAFYDIETSSMRLSDTEERVTLYYGVDPLLYFPRTEIFHWDLASLETFEPNHQVRVEEMMFGPARLWPEGRFAVAGQHYPWKLDWPGNVARIPRIAWNNRRDFYNSQCFMLHAASTPSVCLFEAAACATPIVAYPSTELEKLFTPEVEIFFAENADEVVRIVRDTPYLKRGNVGWAARRRVLREHTISNRVKLLEQFLLEKQDASKVAAD